MLSPMLVIVYVDECILGLNILYAIIIMKYDL